MKHFIPFATALALAVPLAAIPQPAGAQSFHVEVHGGLDRLSGDVGETGLLYGLGTGIDFKIGGKASLGLQANADFSNVEDCASGVVTANDKLCAAAKRDLSAVARLGYNFSEATGIYALAGYTNGRFRLDYTPPTGSATRLHENLDGVRLGLGVEHGLGGGIYTKVEYRYSNYEAGAIRHQLVAGLGLSF